MNPPIPPAHRSSRPRRRPGQARAASASSWSHLLDGRWPHWIDFVALLILMGACALGGGSAFADTFSLLYVRPIAVAAMMLFVLSPANGDWRTVRVPLMMLATLATIMVLQLVPLPPAVWLSLPGRKPYADAITALGFPQPWRPLSLTPDLTANSLAALVVPAAALFGFAKISIEQRRWLVIGLVIMCSVSAVLGVAQFASGKNSALYLYKRTYAGFPVGLLANRNHQAALLALIFPALRMWTLRPAAGRDAGRRRLWIAVALGIFTVPVVLATGSRSGMLVSAISIALTILLFPGKRNGQSATSPYATWLRIGTPALLLAIVLVSYWFGRATSIERLSSVSTIGADQRFQFAPVVVHIIRASFPAGTGFGSFDPVFRQYEPDNILIASYFNHAHNDLLELVLTAGLPGLLLLLAFVVWWSLRTIRALTWSASADPARNHVLLGSLVVLLLFAASLTDYTLHTPLLSAVFAIACGWLGMHSADVKANRVAMPK